MHMELMDKIISNGDKKSMDKLGDIFNQAMEIIEEHDKDEYNRLEMCMYEIAYGKVLNQEMAETWVKNMDPKFKWDMDETNDAMRKMGYNLDPIQFYVVSNMMWSDNYELVKDEPELALRLAYYWLKDKDVGEDKLYNYWRYVVI